MVCVDGSFHVPLFLVVVARAVAASGLAAHGRVAEGATVIARVCVAAMDAIIIFQVGKSNAIFQVAGHGSIRSGICLSLVSPVRIITTIGAEEGTT